MGIIEEVVKAFWQENPLRDIFAPASRDMKIIGISFLIAWHLVLIGIGYFVCMLYYV